MWIRNGLDTGVWTRLISICASDSHEAGALVVLVAGAARVVGGGWGAGHCAPADGYRCREVLTAGTCVREKCSINICALLYAILITIE